VSVQNNEYLSYVRLILGLYILKILQQGPRHGNKITEEIKRCTNDLFTPNTNILYPLLRKMEDKNYIVGQWEHPDTRSKRIYTITETGIGRIPALEIMLEERLKQSEAKIAILRANLLAH
jgi:DNA-binding PadR family transcriptional regulator